MNAIFYFSGTGNSLKVAKTILENIGGGRIVSMANPEKDNFPDQYETAGFVCPVYFWGLPDIVEKYIANMNSKNSAYYYAIVTCGGSAGNALPRLGELLKKHHNIKLDYGEILKMQTNYILHNDFIYRHNFRNVSKTVEKSNEMLCKTTGRIMNRENNKTGGANRIMEFWHEKCMKGISSIDRNYVVNDNCVKCGICEKVCPVKNIRIKNGKPEFSHNCEHCLSCINYCPKKAINYKNITNSRKRYYHPEISHEELSKYNRP